MADTMMALEGTASKVMADHRLGMLLKGRLRLTEVIGCGTSGIVYAATDLFTARQYAVKCIKVPQGGNLAGASCARREAQLHWLVSNHPNVATFSGIIALSDATYIISEHCNDGDLLANIRGKMKCANDERLCKSVFIQILDAVAYCHERGVFHRDLKPENILLTDGCSTVKLTDFGLATSKPASRDHWYGSVPYMSPECLDVSGVNTPYLCGPSDIWSLGVILVNLARGRSPWAEASILDAKYAAYIRSPRAFAASLGFTGELSDIFVRIFETDPAKRISLSELRHRITTCPRLALLVTAPTHSISAPLRRFSHGRAMSGRYCPSKEAHRCGSRRSSPYRTFVSRRTLLHKVINASDANLQPEHDRHSELHYSEET